MDMQSNRNNQRWYEKDTPIGNAVQRVLKLPMPWQEEVLKVSAHSISREFKKIKQEKILGYEKVLAIYKSKQKRRDYDKNPFIHKIMNEILALEPEQQDLVANDLLMVLDGVRQYLFELKHEGGSPSQRDIGVLVSSFMNNGPEGLASFLQERRVSASHKKPPQSSQANSEPKNKEEAIKGTVDDMKVSVD